MKTFLRLLILTSVLALGAGLATAQTCAEPMEGAAKFFNDIGGNIFGCPTSGNTGSAPCGIFYRYYSYDAGSTGGVNPGADGNPIFVTAGLGAYRVDIVNSQNIFGGAPHPCGKNVHLLWDAQQGEGTGDHAGFYGAQSQVVVEGELGNIFADCGGTRVISCFGALAGAEAVAIANTPQGTVNTLAALSPIPVPKVSGSTADTVTLEWETPGNWHQTPAAGNDPGTAPNPILGVNIYLYEDSGVLNSRGVTDADLSSARLLGFFETATTSTVIDFATDVTPGTGTFIPVAKVVYQDDPTDGPMESLFFSANGPVVRVNDALFTEVTGFEGIFMGKSRGQTVTHVTWQTVAEDGLDGFELFRSTSSMSGPWVQVGDFILPTGVGGEGAVYGVDDGFKARGATSVWYKLVIHDSGRNPRDHGPVTTAIPQGGGNIKPNKQ
jgi:hypothetical protein